MLLSAPMCLQIMMQVCGIPWSVCQWPCRDSQLHDSPFEEPPRLHLRLGTISCSSNRSDFRVSQIKAGGATCPPTQDRRGPACVRAPEKKFYFAPTLMWLTRNPFVSPKTALKYPRLPQKHQEKSLKPASPSCFHWQN